MKKITNFIRKYLYYRQHPDTALRYIPIVRLLKKRGWDNDKILEIGSGSYGIAPYLKKNVIGLDTDFSEPKHELLKQVQGVGEKIPFSSNSFDISILSDVLEHVSQNNRATVIQEAIRVSKKAVIISGPFGNEAFNQDKELAKKSNHHFFKEHLELGLPDKKLVENISNKKISEILLIGGYLNLKIRKIIMLLFVSKHKAIYYLYLKGLMPLVPILSKLNKKPTYRYLYLIELKQ